MRLKVLLLAAIFAISVMGFYSPAQAADGITPYANIMTWAGWVQRDKDASGFAKSDTDYYQSNFANAGTNMGIKGEKNGVQVQIEFGVKDGYEAFRSRHAYASYKMGEIGILFGQTLAPWIALDGADLRSGDAMARAGSCYDGWNNQIRVSFFGAYVTILNPGGNSAGDTDKQSTGTIGPKANQDVVIPKIGAGYMFKMDAISVAVNGVFQQTKYDEQSTPSNLDGKALNAWLVNFIFKGQFGPANLSAVAYYATNPGNMGFATYNSSSAVVAASGDKYENTTVMGGRVGAGFKAGMAKFNVGVAYEKATNDYDTGGAGDYGTEGKDDYLVYFANVQLFLQDNFYFAPTVKVEDAKKTTDGVKAGKTTYIGFACVASI